MSFQAGRFSGLVTLFISVLLATAIGAAYYYFQIKQNEKYQNQLHFRELKDISRSIDSGLEQFKNYLSENKKENERRLEYIYKYTSEISSFRVRIHERVLHLNNLKSELNELENEKDKINLKINNIDKAKLGIVENEISEKTASLKILKEEIENIKNETYDLDKKFSNHLLIYTEIFSPINEEIKSKIFGQCKLSNKLNDYCQWFKNYFNNLLDVNAYKYTTGAQFDADYESRFQSVVDDKDVLLIELGNNLKKINTVKENIGKYTEAIRTSTLDSGDIERDLECQNIEISLRKIKCGPLLKLIQEYNDFLKKFNLYAVSTTEDVQSIEITDKLEKYKSNISKKLGEFKVVFEKNYNLQTQKIKLLGDISSIFTKAEFNKDMQSLLKKLVINRHDLPAKKAKELELEEQIYELENKRELALGNISEINEEVESLKSINAKIRSKDENIKNMESDIRESLNKEKEKELIKESLSFLPTTTVSAVNEKYREMINCLSKGLELKNSDQCKIEGIVDESHEHKLLKLGKLLKNLGKVRPHNYSSVIDFQSEDIKLHLIRAAPFLTDKDAHVVSNIKENKNSRAIYHVPFEDFLSSKLNHYPLLLMVDKDGKRIVRKENVQNGSDQHGLIFEHLEQLLAKLFEQQNTLDFNNANYIDNGSPNSSNHSEQNNNTSVLGYSGYTDIEITGIEYRVFITPYETALLQDESDDNRLYYLLGFKLKSDLTSRKLSISNSLVVMVVLLLVFVIAFIPLLKLRFVSSNSAITMQDRRWLLSGFILLAGVITIGIFDQIFYNQLKYSVNDQAHLVFEQLKSSFKDEVDDLNEYAEKEKIVENAGKKLESSNVHKGKNLEFDKKTVSEDNSYFLENLFILPQNGNLMGQAKWSTRYLYRINDIDLSDRNYFKNAINCDVWYRVKKNNECIDGIYFQRIFNLRDGRITTQFSKQIPPKKEKNVLSFGTKLQTFFAPVLPRNFGFLVFENDTGEVLYHSNDERSLIENIYVETDNNPHLHSLIWLNSKTNYNNNSILMNTVYRGEDHNFQVGNLMEGLPLTLVVFYNKNQLRTLNMLSAFTALTLFILLLLIGYIGIKFFRRKNLVRRIFWFDSTIKNHYLSIGGKLLLATVLINILIYTISVYLPSAKFHWGSIGLLWLAVWGVIVWKLNNMLVTSRTLEIEKAKSNDISVEHQISIDKTHIKPFTFYLFSLVIGFVVIPVLLLSMESSKYYLQKYADMEATHLQNRYKVAKGARTEYFETLIDESNQRHFLEKAGDVPCYLSSEKNELTSTCSKEKLKSLSLWIGTVEDSKRKQEEGLITDIWKLASVTYPFSNKTWALNQGQRKYVNGESQKMPDKGMVIDSNYPRLIWNAVKGQWLLIIIMCGLGFLFIIYILRELIVKRLIGVRIPENFRLNDNQWKQQHDNKVNMLKECLKINNENSIHRAKYVQVIRPSELLVEQSLGKDNSDLFLATKQAVNIDELINSSQSVELTCFQQFKINANSASRTVVLKGFELIAMTRDQRLRALEVMEYIVSLGHINIVLLADIAPLYRLTQQAAYPNEQGFDEHANTAEVIRWAKIMNLFTKLYDWTPGTKYVLDDYNDAHAMLNFEAHGWPEIEKIKLLFMQYHKEIKDINSNEEEISPSSIQKYWSAEQVTEFFSANAGAFYRYRWELCTRNERLLLIQMANGDTPNPEDLEPLEHLMRRGYIFRDNGWHIINISFKRFVRSAEDPKVVAEWMQQASESTWKYMRIPIFTLVLAVLGIVAYSATEALESLLAIFTAVLGLIPLLVRNFSFTSGISSIGE